MEGDLIESYKILEEISSVQGRVWGVCSYQEGAYSVITGKSVPGLPPMARPVYSLSLSLSGPTANAILEMSKEKPAERNLDRHALQFTASVQRVEMELSSQIRYLTQVATGQPHEGSSYSARKDAQMAVNRVEYTHVKVRDLARSCDQMLEQP
ncbi:mediator of RNA polymerase II transcription subunit 11 [Chiloscyllium punctatum]|uniref:mediator of RNA polymerase II transcription subunit 11 n=1 Tax=Chiloscyllium punctatum TaxID=137246 RepID=UPI003B64199B